MEERQPALDNITEAAFSYTRADGTIETANSLEEAQRVCPFLGGMSLEEAEVFMSLLPQEDEKPIIDEPIRQQAPDQSSWERHSSLAAKPTKITVTETTVSDTPDQILGPSPQELLTLNDQNLDQFTSPLQEIYPRLDQTHRQAEKLVADTNETSPSAVTQAVEAQRNLEQDFYELVRQESSLEDEIPIRPTTIPAKPQQPVAQPTEIINNTATAVPKSSRNTSAPSGSPMEYSHPKIPPAYTLEDDTHSVIDEGREVISLDITEGLIAEDNTTDTLPWYSPELSLDIRGAEDEVVNNPAAEQWPYDDIEILTPLITELSEGKQPSSLAANPEFMETITRLQEAADTAELNMLIGAPVELTQQTVEDLKFVLEQMGCEEPQKIIRRFIDTHNLQELFDTLEHELPELFKLVDYQQYLLATLNKRSSQDDRILTLARAIYELLLGPRTQLAASAV